MWPRPPRSSDRRVCVLVTQSCPTLSDPRDCSMPGSSVCEIFQIRILEWACHSLLQEIFPTQGSNLGLLHCRRFFTLSHQGRVPPTELNECRMDLRAPILCHHKSRHLLTNLETMPERWGRNRRGSLI